LRKEVAMYDSSRIESREFWVFSHLTSEFFEAKRENFERYNNPYKYKLWNNWAKKGKYFITVEAYVEGDTKLLRITGSLRKWYYGAKSTKDFIKEDFVKALRLVSRYLEISYNSILEFNVSRVEIGRNIRLKVPVSPFLGIVAGFSSNSYKLRQEKGWRHFRTGNFKVTLYDKIQEINKNKKPKRKLINELDDNQQYKKKVNLLRIEFTIMGGMSKVQTKLGFSSLREFVDNYQELYVFYWKNCKKLRLLEDFPINIIPMNNSWGDLKKVILEEAIKSQGYDRIMDLCSYLEGKVKRDAHAYLKKVFCFSIDNSISNNRHVLLRAIRVELIIHLIKSGWAKESSRMVPPINYNI